MHRGNSIWVLSPFVVAMLACTSGGEGVGPQSERVQIRVENGSAAVFDEVTLFLPQVSLSYSNLQPGEVTPYTTVTEAYRIASVRVVMGQDTTRLQVIDYVGEKPLGSGYYTYVLSLFEGDPKSLIMDLESGP